MDMRSLAGALPDFSARAYPQQSFQHIGIPGAHSQGVVYQLPPGAQFAGQAGGAQQFPQHYNQSQQSRPGAFSNFVGASSAGGQPQSFHSPGQQTMVPGHPHMQQFLHPQPPTHYGANFATRGYQQPLRINPTAHSIYQNPGQHSKLTITDIRLATDMRRCYSNQLELIHAGRLFVCTSRTTQKTQAIRTRPLGWQFATRDTHY